MIHGAPFCATCKSEKLLDVRSGTDSAALNLASLGKRFVAFFLDRLLFTVPLIVLMFVGIFSMAGRKNSDPMIFVSGFAIGVFSFILGYVIYEALMLANRGQTLGKIVMRIKVVRIDGTAISAGQAWGRAVLRIVLSGILSLLNYIPAFATKEKTCIHDLVAGTRVVMVE